ncbi:Lhr family helicase [Rhodanobacter lindaniclasticus]
MLYLLHPCSQSPKGRGGDGGASRRVDSIETEHIARTLLRRYGVVFWKLLEREAPWLPPWRELSRVYQRLEARGEIRGGRFVEGLVGEQFALPEAIAPLRAARARADDGELVCLSGCDPLDTVGTVLAGDKVPALAGARVLYRDGVPIAALVGGKVLPLVELSSADAQQAKHVLLRTPLRRCTPLVQQRAEARRSSRRSRALEIHGCARLDWRFAGVDRVDRERGGRAAKRNSTTANTNRPSNQAVHVKPSPEQPLRQWP